MITESPPFYLIIKAPTPRLAAVALLSFLFLAATSDPVTAGQTEPNQVRDLRTWTGDRVFKTKVPLAITASYSGTLSSGTRVTGEEAKALTRVHGDRSISYMVETLVWSFPAYAKDFRKSIRAGTEVWAAAVISKENQIDVYVGEIDSGRRQSSGFARIVLDYPRATSSVSELVRQLGAVLDTAGEEERILLLDSQLSSLGAQVTASPETQAQSIEAIQASTSQYAQLLEVAVQWTIEVRGLPATWDEIVSRAVAWHQSCEVKLADWRASRSARRLQVLNRIRDELAMLSDSATRTGITPREQRESANILHGFISSLLEADQSEFQLTAASESSLKNLRRDLRRWLQTVETGNSRCETDGPIGLDAVEQLVQRGFADGAVAGQISDCGISFVPTVEVISRLASWGLGDLGVNALQTAPLRAPLLVLLPSTEDLNHLELLDAEAEEGPACSTSRFAWLLNPDGNRKATALASEDWRIPIPSARLLFEDAERLCSSTGVRDGSLLLTTDLLMQIASRHRGQLVDSGIKCLWSREVNRRRSKAWLADVELMVKKKEDADTRLCGVVCTR